MFKMESCPYLLTLLFVALGWTLTHFVTQIGNSPIIEYNKTLSNDHKVISYVVQNISRTVRFEGLEFYIILDEKKEGRCQGKPNLEVYPPLHLGKDPKEPICLEGREAIFKIKEFHPYSTILMTVQSDKETDAKIRLISKKAVRFLKSNYQTFFIKYELELLISIISFWIVLILCYFIFLNKGGK